jgi:organic radical activating enzyme
LEKDGDGILIVNASTVLHLNETAAEYAYHLVNCTPEDQVAKTIASRYRINRSQAMQDYLEFKENIDTLVTTPDLDPVMFLNFERQEPYSGHIGAPYRLDCALTYRLPDGVDPDFAPTKRVTRELSTDEWKRILDKSWEIGIPHIIFTGGEPTLREDLVPLIEKAEDNGQVTGLLTDGFNLGNKEYLDSLLQTGLDHVLFILHPEIDQAWTALKSVLEEDIYTAVHLTITPLNVDEIHDLIHKLDEINVCALSLSATEESLDSDLESARELAAELEIDLVWDIPVPYSTHNPVAVEIEADEIGVTEGSGLAWLYIEPDGDILPSQEINKVLGNVLSDTWEQIWSQHEE